MSVDNVRTENQILPGLSLAINRREEGKTFTLSRILLNSCKYCSLPAADPGYECVMCDSSQTPPNLIVSLSLIYTHPFIQFCSKTVSLEIIVLDSLIDSVEDSDI